MGGKRLDFNREAKRAKISRERREPHVRVVLSAPMKLPAYQRESRKIDPKIKLARVSILEKD